jgi:hypothetical protein
LPNPITRSLQLAAVRKDAAALTAVEAGNGRRVYTFKASDGDFDRYSDRLSVKGWRVDAYNANGVVLFNHDDGAQAAWTGAAPALPIGKGRVYVENDALMIDVEFDFDCDAQELLEVSIVTIPENARALRAKSLEGESDDIVERIAKRVVELLDARADAKVPEDKNGKPDAGDEQGDAPNTGDEPAAPNESKPETGEPPPAEPPKADDEDDDKAKGLDAAEAAKGFVEAFKGYIRGSDKE